MPIEPDDWRLRGQEGYLAGAAVTWKRYQALSAEWEHEHCVFCWHTFLDADYSDTAAQALRDDPEKQSPAGYTNVAAAERPAGKWWICEACFADFHEQFSWTVADSDPDAWPYPGPEPDPRPTAADYDRGQWAAGTRGRWLKRPESDDPA